MSYGGSGGGDDFGSNTVGNIERERERNRNLEHIALLQERNRLKKLMSVKSKEELDIEEKERGFSTHFRGANATAADKVASVKRQAFSTKTPSVSSSHLSSGLLMAAVSRGKVTTSTVESVMAPAPLFAMDANPASSSKKGWATPTGNAASDSGDGSYDNDSTRFSPTRHLARRNQKQDEDVGNALLQRIAGLDLQQQALLFRLLDTSDLGTAANSKSPTRKKFTEAAASEFSEARLYESDEECVLPEQELSPVLKSQDNLVGASSLSIRIRVFSVWGQSKFASLAGVRLLLDGGISIDILKYFRVQILCGLHVQPPLSDSVRDVNALVSTSSSSLSHQLTWRGPFDADSPLEIRLEEKSGTTSVFEAFGGGERLASQLKIALWNAEVTSSGPSSTSLPLPAKDVDVYVNARCIWSGQLPTETSTLGEKSSYLGREMPMPTLSIPAFPAKITSRAGTPASRQIDNPPRDLSNVSAATSLPSWLQGLREVSTAVEQDCHPSEEARHRTPRPTSARLSAMQRQDEVSINNNSSSSSEKKRRTRRQLEADKTPEEKLDDALTYKPRSDGKTDEQLRMSISALRDADTHSRGRLGRSLFGDGDEGLGAPSPVTNATTNDKLNPLEAASSIDSLQLSSPPPRNSPRLAVKNIDDAKLNRNRRIDEVQTAVQSALAGLAGIMSGLQQSRSSTSIAESLEDSGFFALPVLPRGITLKIDILNTWGDSHYVGLNGLDIFDSSGILLTSNIRQIVANPMDVNVLPDVKNDPRTVSNLISGTNFTRDDLHVWLAPQGFYYHHEGEIPNTTASPLPIATITITFTQPVDLSMIRIFNYNKSRTHSTRGAKTVRISLDDNVIFAGEIRMAPGLLTSVDAASEVILFTTDDATLQKIAKQDENAGYYLDDSTAKWVGKLLDRHIERPTTADKSPSSSTLLPRPAPRTISRHTKVPSTCVPTGDIGLQQGEFRPSTSPSIEALIDAQPQPPAAILPTVDDLDDDEAFFAELRAVMPLDSPESAIRSSPIVFEHHSQGNLHSAVHSTFAVADLVAACAIAIVIEQTWGDADFVGLTSVSILAGPKGQSLPIAHRQITAVPRDMSAVGRFDDPRTADKLVDGVNETTDENHMWLIPYAKGSDHFVRFDFDKSELLAGLTIWNYNKSGDVVRGAKVVTLVSYDARGIATNLGRCVLRPGPGCDGVQFGQRILFRELPKQALSRPSMAASYISPPVRQDYEVPYLPCGQLFKLSLFDNHGDNYFIGLDGLELFDESNNLIVVDGVRASITAVPHSLQDLTMEGSVCDPRTPDKLFFRRENGGACPGEEHHVPWLSPIARCMTPEERQVAGKRAQSGSKVAKADFSYHPENTLFVLFHAPQTLSLIRFYNYGKTSARGVKSIAIHVDGKLIFMGNLVPANKEPLVEGVRGTERRGQSILFVADPKVKQQEKDRVSYTLADKEDQQVLCIDERVVKVKSSRMYSTDASTNPFAERESPSVFVSTQRPKTSLIGDRR